MGSNVNMAERESICELPLLGSSSGVGSESQDRRSPGTMRKVYTAASVSELSWARYPRSPLSSHLYTHKRKNTEVSNSVQNKETPDGTFQGRASLTSNIVNWPNMIKVFSFEGLM